MPNAPLRPCGNDGAPAGMTRAPHALSRASQCTSPWNIDVQWGGRFTRPARAPCGHVVRWTTTLVVQRGFDR